MTESPQPSPAVDPLGAVEERFDQARRRLGLWLGPLLMALVLALPLPLPSAEAARLAGVLALVLVWWITEAVPLPVTALLGPALAVLLGVGRASEMFAPFGDPIVKRCLGGVLL
ncbi:MAG: anion transporter, partial [Betaproteobacteria bacterium]